MPELTTTMHADPQEPAGPRICFHPGDAWLAAAPGRPVSPCFHPGDDEPSGELDRGVSPCFHPGDDDAAAGLHRSLTEIDERALAVLARR
jgi:hypothetical protein